jgi:hypothetical protein
LDTGTGPPRVPEAATHLLLEGSALIALLPKAAARGRRLRRQLQESESVRRGQARVGRAAPVRPQPWQLLGGGEGHARVGVAVAHDRSARLQRAQQGLPAQQEAAGGSRRTYRWRADRPVRRGCGRMAACWLACVLAGSRARLFSHRLAEKSRCTAASSISLWLVR